MIGVSRHTMSALKIAIGTDGITRTHQTTTDGLKDIDMNWCEDCNHPKHTDVCHWCDCEVKP